MSAEDDLERDVGDAIRAARARGAQSFYDVLAFCEGADPSLVARIFGASGADAPDGSTAVARRETSELAALFPAADPVACQWWYTLDAIDSLANRAYQAAPPGSRAAFLGAPTVGYQYSRRWRGATVFDIDEHVVASLATAGGLDALAYDVAHPLPSGHSGVYAVVLVDPPWYPEVLRAFLGRALEMGEGGANVFCSLPPRLTRPGIVHERQELIQALLTAGVEIVGIERSATRYLVPEFERVALRGVAHFDGRPWRTGDLLHLRRAAGTGSTTLGAAPIPPYRIRAFARNPKRYRVFLRMDVAADSTLAGWVQRMVDFETTVSRRKINPSVLHWWTTDKRGGTLRDSKLVERALDLWAKERLGSEETRDRLVHQGVESDVARTLCHDLDEHLGLWKTHGGGIVRVRPDLAATTASSRPYPKKDDDGYRSPFQRDRDRVTWSRGLRQLANKTQVFPLETGDYLRNRLSHSLEVMQLATTIGAAFGLNLNLIEAGALAHDIGHTPFGHAGEFALDALFAEMKSSLGFSHYEHGVDVVRWLEDAYQSPSLGGLFGLNITPEVAESIFKHTYCHVGGPVCQTELYNKSKHKAYFSNDRCHVEGQAVRIADKVSYLISDLEDGIRLGALTISDLLDCRLLRRPPIDLLVSPSESLHERFLSQRSLLIGILMEDIIEASAARLATMASVAEVRNARFYTIDHSEELGTEVGEVWTKLQAGKLHTDARVRIANLRAARIVRELTLLFTVAPQLVEARFREGHRRLHDTDYLAFYRNQTGSKVKLPKTLLGFVAQDGGTALGFDPGKDPEVPVEHLIQAKDFVAGLSDERARSIHHELLAF